MAHPLHSLKIERLCSACEQERNTRLESLESLEVERQIERAAQRQTSLESSDNHYRRLALERSESH